MSLSNMPAISFANPTIAAETNRFHNLDVSPSISIGLLVLCYCALSGPKDSGKQAQYESKVGKPVRYSGLAAMFGICFGFLGLEVCRSPSSPPIRFGFSVCKEGGVCHLVSKNTELPSLGLRVTLPSRTEAAVSEMSVVCCSRRSSRLGHGLGIRFIQRFIRPGKDS